MYLPLFSVGLHMNVHIFNLIHETDMLLLCIASIYLEPPNNDQF